MRYSIFVEEPAGLRERKKLRTRRTISDAAITLFLERGYDAVSIADVAAAAEVARATLFAYFPTKDDLVLHRFADHEDEPARVVRDRRTGESPLDALHRHLRDTLDRRDPITGLCDLPDVVAFYRLLQITPALSAATTGYLTRAEDALTAALREAVPDENPLTARLAASQIIAVRQTLAAANQRRIVAGRTADDLAQDAHDEADHAFELLSGGLAPYRGTRR